MGNPQELYAERLQLVNDTVAMKETSRIPMVPFVASIMQSMYGSNYKDIFYDYDKAGMAMMAFFKDYPVDATIGTQFMSGKANEVSEIDIVDWPGKPGTVISDYSSHQVKERPFIEPEEYKEMLTDYTGFMLRKYFPRVFPGLKGLSSIDFPIVTVLDTGVLAGLYTPEALEAYSKLAEIAKHNAELAQTNFKYIGMLAGAGIPSFITGAGEVPFDIISDYFRGTMGAAMDLFEYEEEIIELCDLFADKLIASWQYFRFADLPVKRVFFPLHKAMDGFMSPEHFERVYWKPYAKMLDALIDMGVTPYIYTEGKYNSRLDQMAEWLPAGKCIVHFEEVDMKRAKETVGKNSCITGNLPIYMMENGTPEEVVNYTKWLIDTCAPGGGYIFDFDGCLESAKKENMDALWETVYTYGAK